MTKHSVCFFGDEIMLGLSDPDGGGWVRRLANAERGQGHLIVPYLMAMEGDTSASIAPRWLDEARSRLTGLPASALVFCFGLHDQASSQQDVQVSLLDTLYYAEAMLSEATAWRTVFWIGPPPVVSGATSVGGRHPRKLFYDQIRVQGTSQAFASIAGRCGVPYLDLSRGLLDSTRYMRSLRQGNGVVPDADGQALIAEVIENWKPWRHWLDRGVSPNFCEIARTEAELNGPRVMGTHSPVSGLQLPQ